MYRYLLLSLALTGFFTQQVFAALEDDREVLDLPLPRDPLNNFSALQNHVLFLERLDSIALDDSPQQDSVAYFEYLITKSWWGAVDQSGQLMHRPVAIPSEINTMNLIPTVTTLSFQLYMLALAHKKTFNAGSKYVEHTRQLPDVLRDVASLLKNNSLSGELKQTLLKAAFAALNQILTQNTYVNHRPYVEASAHFLLQVSNILKRSLVLPSDQFDTQYFEIQYLHLMARFIHRHKQKFENFLNIAQPRDDSGAAYFTSEEGIAHVFERRAVSPKYREQLRHILVLLRHWLIPYAQTKKNNRILTLIKGLTSFDAPKIEVPSLGESFDYAVSEGFLLTSGGRDRAIAVIGSLAAYTKASIATRRSGEAVNLDELRKVVDKSWSNGSGRPSGARIIDEDTDVIAKDRAQSGRMSFVRTYQMHALALALTHAHQLNINDGALQEEFKALKAKNGILIDAALRQVRQVLGNIKLDEKLQLWNAILNAVEASIVYSQMDIQHVDHYTSGIEHGIGQLLDEIHESEGWRHPEQDFLQQSYARLHLRALLLAARFAQKDPRRLILLGKSLGGATGFITELKIAAGTDHHDRRRLVREVVEAAQPWLNARAVGDYDDDLKELIHESSPFASLTLEHLRHTCRLFDPL